MAKLTHLISPAPSVSESLPLPESWSASNSYLISGINTVRNASRPGARAALRRVPFAGLRSNANEASLVVRTKERRRRYKNWAWNVETVVGKVRTWCFRQHLACNRTWMMAICLRTITTARTTSHVRTRWNKKKKSTRNCRRSRQNNKKNMRKRCKRRKNARKP